MEQRTLPQGRHVRGAWIVTGAVLLVMTALWLNIAFTGSFDDGVGNDVFNAMLLKP